MKNRDKDPILHDKLAIGTQRLLQYINDRHIKLDAQGITESGDKMIDLTSFLLRTVAVDKSSEDANDIELNLLQTWHLIECFSFEDGFVFSNLVDWLNCYYPRMLEEDLVCCQIDVEKFHSKSEFFWPVIYFFLLKGDFLFVSKYLKLYKNENSDNQTDVISSLVLLLLSFPSVKIRIKEKPQILEYFQAIGDSVLYSYSKNFRFDFRQEETYIDGSLLLSGFSEIEKDSFYNSIILVEELEQRKEANLLVNTRYRHWKTNLESFCNRFNNEIAADENLLNLTQILKGDVAATVSVLNLKNDSKLSLLSGLLLFSIDDKSKHGCSKVFNAILASIVGENDQPSCFSLVEEISQGDGRIIMKALQKLDVSYGIGSFTKFSLSILLQQNVVKLEREVLRHVFELFQNQNSYPFQFTVDLFEQFFQALLLSSKVSEIKDFVVECVKEFDLVKDEDGEKIMQSCKKLGFPEIGEGVAHTRFRHWVGLTKSEGLDLISNAFKWLFKLPADVIQRECQQLIKMASFRNMVQLAKAYRVNDTLTVPEKQEQFLDFVLSLKRIIGGQEVTSSLLKKAIDSRQQDQAKNPPKKLKVATESYFQDEVSSAGVPSLELIITQAFRKRDETIAVLMLMLKEQGNIPAKFVGPLIIFVVLFEKTLVQSFTKESEKAAVLALITQNPMKLSYRDSNSIFQMLKSCERERISQEDLETGFEILANLKGRALLSHIVS